MPYLVEMKPDELNDAIKQKIALIVPVGSVEFHGGQLPIGTDLFITQGIAERLEQIASIIIAPSIVFSPTGYMVSGVDKGTIDLDVDIFISHTGQILNNYKNMGFDTIIVMMHHQGGNIANFINTAWLKYTTYNKYKDLGMSWWTDKVNSKQCNFKVLPAMLDTGFFGGHGGKGETEAIMALRPNLVDMKKAGSPTIWWNQGAEQASADQANKKLEKLLKLWKEKIESIYKQG